jgi:hypothetical protein
MDVNNKFYNNEEITQLQKENEENYKVNDTNIKKFYSFLNISLNEYNNILLELDK